MKKIIFYSCIALILSLTTLKYTYALKVENNHYDINMNIYCNNKLINFSNVQAGDILTFVITINPSNTNGPYLVEINMPDGISIDPNSISFEYHQFSSISINNNLIRYFSDNSNFTALIEYKATVTSTNAGEFLYTDLKFNKIFPLSNNILTVFVINDDVLSQDIPVTNDFNNIVLLSTLSITSLYICLFKTLNLQRKT